jgi:hypothetical protein
VAHLMLISICICISFFSFFFRWQFLCILDWDPSEVTWLWEFKRRIHDVLSTILMEIEFRVCDSSRQPSWYISRPREP